jgi:hypothetical protein
MGFLLFLGLGLCELMLLLGLNLTVADLSLLSSVIATSSARLSQLVIMVKRKDFTSKYQPSQFPH